MISRRQLLEHAKAQEAADIHICANAPILFRTGGKLVPVTKEEITAQQSRELALDLLTDAQKKLLEERLDYDLMLAEESGRYRVNVGYFDGHVGATIRILPTHPRTINDLLLPETVRDLAHRRKGLVLITGATSQGKTTTLAAMIDEVNATQEKHVITGAAKNIIRRKGSYFLRSVIETGKKHGMLTMEESIGALLEQKIITDGVAQSILVNYK